MFYSNRTSSYEHASFNILKFIRFDTVNFANGDSIFIPYRSVQNIGNNCLTPYGASWIGGKIVIEANGDHLLFNHKLDTIKIKTKGNTGDSWLCYSDKWLNIEAVILSNSSESILGLGDSVKTIAFKAFDKDMNEQALPLNDMQIQISKNYGVTQTLNFYSFPATALNTYPWLELSEWNLAGLSNPKIGIQNLTWFDVHDFDPGDEIHVEYENSDWFTLYNGVGWDLVSGYTRNTKTKKKYLERNEYHDSIIYLIEREGRSYDQEDDRVKVSYYHDTITEVIVSNPDFDRLPDEAYFIADAGMGDPVAYTMTMNATSPLSKSLPLDFGSIWQWDDDESCWSDCCIDGCFPARTYFKGLGGPYGRCSNFDSYGGEARTYIYYKKGDESWGTPLDLTPSPQSPALPNIRIFPNPASDLVYIESCGEQIDNLTLYDLSGKIILNMHCQSNVCTFQLNDVNPGIYILSIQSGQSSVQQRLFVD